MEAIIKYNARTHLLVLAVKTWPNNISNKSSDSSFNINNNNNHSSFNKNNNNHISGNNNNKTFFFKLDTITNVQIEFG